MIINILKYVLQHLNKIDELNILKLNIIIATDHVTNTRKRKREYKKLA